MKLVSIKNMYNLDYINQDLVFEFNLDNIDRINLY